MKSVLWSLVFCSFLPAAQPTCSTCHSKIAATFAKTGMARSFSRPGEIQPTRYYHKLSATWYEITKHDDGAYYQRRWRIGHQGQETEIQDSRIDYVMGSGNHVRTFLHRTDRGKLIELPLAWYSENGGEWAMNPGHDRDYALPPRAVAYECMFCHNSYPSIPAGHELYGSEPLYTDPLPEGIGCTRCHGPGENHMRLAQTAGSKVEDIRKAIVKNRGMEVCLQCHLETTSLQLPHSIVKYGRAPFSYNPAEPLANFMLFFDHAPGSSYQNDFEIAHSAYRLRKSRCTPLTCTTCHDPHDIPRGQEATDHYNGVCRQCHAQHSINATDCISCHMPKRRTQDVIHAVMTDHYIQRRPPPNLLAPLAERTESVANGYHGKVVPYYTAADSLYQAVAQVTQETNLKAGLPVLAAEIARQQPSRPEFYVELGEAYLNTHNPRAALGAFQQALNRTPRLPVALLDLAEALSEIGQPQRAADLLQKENSDDPLFWYQAGMFEKALALDPDLAAAHNERGEQFATAGQMDRAEGEFRAALRSEPDLPAAQSNLGHLLAARGDLAQAAWYFSRAVRRSPNDADTHLNYAVTLRGLNRQDEALRECNAALRIRPNFGLAHLNAAEILSARGDRAAAHIHLLQAARDDDPDVRRRATSELNRR